MKMSSHSDACGLLLSSQNNVTVVPVTPSTIIFVGVLH